MTSAAKRRPTVVAALAALLGLGVVVIGVNPSIADAGISWSSANPPLPANAVAGQGMSIVSSACPADGWCVAVGDYVASSGPNTYDAGLILSESGGTWTALEAPLPANEQSADPQALVGSVSCASVGSCVAVGRYVDDTGATQGLIETLSSGSWSGSEAPVPPGSMSGGTSDFAQLTSVSCPSPAACVAVGVATGAAGGQQADVDALSGGTWSSVSAPLPGAASGSQFIALSCPSSAWCVATGTYEVSGIYLGMADTLSGGVWTSAALPLPSGASPLASVANNDLAVSCSTPGSCAVAGTTFDGSFEGVLDSLSGGTWTAQPAPTPGAEASTDVQLTSVSCSDAATCVASGLVSVGGVEQGLFESLSAGTWSASQAPVPAGTQASADIEALDVACPSDGTCVAEGQSDVTGSINGLLWNLSGGSWAPTAAPLPSDASSASDPSFAPVACPATGVCVAVGTYIGTSGAREGVIDTDPSLGATTTTVSLTSMSSGSAVYSATVTGTAEAQPGGTVVFSSGLQYLCTAVLSGGSASCTGPTPPGATILGSYSGDAVSSPSWGTTANPGAPALVYVVSGWIQSTKVNTFFGAPLQVRVIGASGAGVPGVPVTFLLPTSGASAVFWGYASTTTNAGGYAVSPYLSADGSVGSFNPVAIAAGVPNSAVFYLANTKK